MNYRFGMATVCPQGYAPNKSYRKKRGQRQCLKTRAPKPSLSDLQALAQQHEVSIYKRRKDDMGFTKQPLTKTALKYRLTKMKVPYGSGSGSKVRDVVPVVGTQVLPQGVPVVQGSVIAPMDFGFGMATVCRPGTVPNPFWKKGRGQRQCVVKVKSAKKTLKQLQALAKKNSVSIYKRRKDDMGFTKTKLPIKALKYRLSKMKVAY
jgi:hypothetical protein